MTVAGQARVGAPAGAARHRRPVPGARRVTHLTVGAVALAALALVALALVARSWLGAEGLGAALPFGGEPAVAVREPPDLAEPAPGQEAPAAGPGAGRAAAPRPPVTGQPLHLRIASIGLDVDVGRMTVPPGGGVDPPTARSAYWLTGYGVAGPTADNTAYVAAHTCRGKGCRAAFSPMLDIPTSTTRVHPGDRAVVTTPEGEWTYTVTDTALYDKPSVPDQQEMWRAVPGRLVLVTCFQYAGGTSSQQNFVVYAQLDPS